MSIRKAKQLIQDGEHEQALKLLSSDPTTSTSYPASVLAGKAASSLQQWDKAERFFRDAVEVESALMPAWLGLAELFTSTDNYPGQAETRTAQLEIATANNKPANAIKFASQLAVAQSKCAEHRQATDTWILVVESLRADEEIAASSSNDVPTEFEAIDALLASLSKVKRVEETEVVETKVSGLQLRQAWLGMVADNRAGEANPVCDPLQVTQALLCRTIGFFPSESLITALDRMINLCDMLVKNLSALVNRSIDNLRGMTLEEISGMSKFELSASSALMCACAARLLVDEQLSFMQSTISGSCEPIAKFVATCAQVLTGDAAREQLSSSSSAAAQLCELAVAAGWRGWLSMCQQYLFTAQGSSLSPLSARICNDMAVRLLQTSKGMVASRVKQRAAMRPRVTKLISLSSVKRSDSATSQASAEQTPEPVSRKVLSIDELEDVVFVQSVALWVVRSRVFSYWTFGDGQSAQVVAKALLKYASEANAAENTLSNTIFPRAPASVPAGGDKAQVLLTVAQRAVAALTVQAHIQLKQYDACIALDHLLLLDGEQSSIKSNNGGITTYVCGTKETAGLARIDTQFDITLAQSQIALIRHDQQRSQLLCSNVIELASEFGCHARTNVAQSHMAWILEHQARQAVTSTDENATATASQLRIDATQRLVLATSPQGADQAISDDVIALIRAGSKPAADVIACRLALPVSADYLFRRAFVAWETAKSFAGHANEIDNSQAVAAAKECFDSLVRAAKINPSHAMSFALLGAHYLGVDFQTACSDTHELDTSHARDVERGARCLEKAVELDVLCPLALGLLHGLNAGKGEHVGNATLYRRVLDAVEHAQFHGEKSRVTVASCAAWAWKHLGQLQFWHGKYESAVISFQKAVSLEQVRQNATAEHVEREGIDVNVDSSDEEAEFESGSGRGVTTLIGQVMSQDAERSPRVVMVDCLQRLGESYMRMGRNTAALKTFERALPLAQQEQEEKCSDHSDVTKSALAQASSNIPAGSMVEFTIFRLGTLSLCLTKFDAAVEYLESIGHEGQRGSLMVAKALGDGLLEQAREHVSVGAFGFAIRALQRALVCVNECLKSSTPQGRSNSSLTVGSNLVSVWKLRGDLMSLMCSCLPVRSVVFNEGVEEKYSQENELLNISSLSSWSSEQEKYDLHTQTVTFQESSIAYAEACWNAPWLVSTWYDFGAVAHNHAEQLAISGASVQDVQTVRDNAKRTANICASLAPENPQAWNLLAALHHVGVDNDVTNANADTHMDVVECTKGTMLQQHCLVRALQVDPRCYEAWTNLGLLLTRFRQASLGRRALGLAQSIEPDTSAVWAGLAAVSELELVMGTSGNGSNINRSIDGVRSRRVLEAFESAANAQGSGMTPVGLWASRRWVRLQLSARASHGHRSAERDSEDGLWGAIHRRLQVCIQRDQHDPFVFALAGLCFERMRKFEDAAAAFGRVLVICREEKGEHGLIACAHAHKVRCELMLGVDSTITSLGNWASASEDLPASVRMIQGLNRVAALRSTGDRHGAREALDSTSRSVGERERVRVQLQALINAAAPEDKSTNPDVIVSEAIAMLEAVRACSYAESGSVEPWFPLLAMACKMSTVCSGALDRMSADAVANQRKISDGVVHALVETTVGVLDSAFQCLSHRLCGSQQHNALARATVEYTVAKCRMFQHRQDTNDEAMGLASLVHQHPNYALGWIALGSATLRRAIESHSHDARVLATAATSALACAQSALKLNDPSTHPDAQLLFARAASVFGTASAFPCLGGVQRQDAGRQTGTEDAVVAAETALWDAPFNRDAQRTMANAWLCRANVAQGEASDAYTNAAHRVYTLLCANHDSQGVLENIHTVLSKTVASDYIGLVNCSLLRAGSLKSQNEEDANVYVDVADATTERLASCARNIGWLEIEVALLRGRVASARGVPVFAHYKTALEGGQGKDVLVWLELAQALASTSTSGRGNPEAATICLKEALRFGRVPKRQVPAWGSTLEELVRKRMESVKG